jgi:hypothetical protein
VNSVQDIDEKTPVAARKIDINLFRVFSAVMQHRSVASAARAVLHGRGGDVWKMIKENFV